MLGRRQISEKITNWFHKKTANNMAPSFIVAIVHAKFINFCKSKGLNLAVSSEQLKESLSEATCVMYYAKLVNKGWDGPHRDVKIPPSWTDEYEKIWLEYLDNYLFTDDYWDIFWKTFYVDSCENDIPRWRINMQIILPQYVLREIAVLKSGNVILDQAHSYIDEKTQETVYDEECDDND